MITGEEVTTILQTFKTIGQPAVSAIVKVLAHVGWDSDKLRDAAIETDDETIQILEAEIASIQAAK